jgi:hypothetical protein
LDAEDNIHKIELVYLNQIAPKDHRIINWEVN